MNDNLTRIETPTTSSNVSFILGIGTATLLGLTTVYGNVIPEDIKITHKPFDLEYFSDKFFDQSYYKIIESDNSLEKSRIILSFAQKMLNSSVDLDPEVVSLVDKRFWDLI